MTQNKKNTQTTNQEMMTPGQKVKATFIIFENLATKQINKKDNALTRGEIYRQFMSEIKTAKSLPAQIKARDKHDRLIRSLMDSIKQVTDGLFAKNFIVTDAQKLHIALLMAELDTALLVYPFGETIKLIPTIDSLEMSIFPFFEDALELAEVDKPEARICFMEVETYIYQWREKAEKNRLEKLTLAVKVVNRLIERTETKK